METGDEAGDSANPTLRNLLLAAASVDQTSSSTCSSLCGGLHTVPSNTQLHLVASSAAAGHNSFSDDSGCLVHTNSSISDSSRHYLNCFELIESDGEVSQFDSLDNSEGGMSTENFNTLKKGPLAAPIDPPPEFQDSPQTTMMRRNLQINTTATTTTTSGTPSTCPKGYYNDFAQLLIKDILGEAFLSILQHNPRPSDDEDEEEEQERFPSPYTNTVIKRTRVFSASDPQLNISASAFVYPHTTAIAATLENIYDEPSDSTRNSDDIEVDYYISKQERREKSSTLSANSQRLSSLQLRPNSGHSLQSRLSSSHNSLATTVTSKVDDTTFITQAMSHDPLMSRRSILDFYNVPLDSDIYALPVDVVVGSSEEVVAAEGKVLVVAAVGDHQQKRRVNNSNHSHHNRRLRLPSNGREGAPASGPSSTQYMSKSSEAKRRLFRKAQNAAAVNNSSSSAKLSTTASQSQLPVNNNNTSLSIAAGSSASSSSSAIVNAKRFSAPDGLAIEAGGYAGSGGGGQGKHNGSSSIINNSNNNKKRGKREKRRGAAGAADSHSHSHNAATSHQQQVAPGTSDYSSDKDAGAVAVAGSNNKEKEREKEKKATIPISTSFTSQSSMQSNCGTGGGGGAAAAAATENGKSTNKRESSRDATKRGHNQFSTNLKQKFCSIFRFRNNKSSSQLAEYEYNYGIASAGGGGAGGGQKSNASSSNNNNNSTSAKKSSAATIMLRALPPLPKRAPPEVPVINGASSSEANRRRPPAELPPQSPESSAVETDSNNNDVLSGTEPVLGDIVEPAPETGRVDFASNLETIKQYGWYWGPISCQAAEKILRNEPDGSFIVRDSSDDHYIFSLTFKLNNCVRHVRIEQDKGTFSFGTLAKFKARTIVEFIEQALEYSRSGRYLFFLHRRPEHGPMRVQLKNPVSRFKHIQSLQHMCRFVIMKAVVRKDLISSLPLPNRLKDYLSYKNCYTEEHFIDEGNGDGDAQESTAAEPGAEVTEGGDPNGTAEPQGEGN